MTLTVILHEDCCGVAIYFGDKGVMRTTPKNVVFLTNTFQKQTVKKGTTCLRGAIG